MRNLNLESLAIERFVEEVVDAIADGVAERLSDGRAEGDRWRDRRAAAGWMGVDDAAESRDVLGGKERPEEA